MLIPLIFILPRMTDSLHPGNGGNPGFNVYDMNSQLRIVFYPAVIGFILLGIWITNIRVKIKLSLIKEFVQRCREGKKSNKNIIFLLNILLFKKSIKNKIPTVPNKFMTKSKFE